MDKNLENLLIEWPLPTIRDVDIATVFPDSAPRRHAAVSRALKKEHLVRLRRGLYLIGKPFKRSSHSLFQIAHSIYGPSYISFESALFHHQWIPEGVYTTTCATAKRAAEFETPIGLFQYLHVPDLLCYLGVQRIGNDDDAFLLADPWKAIADFYYAHKREWQSPKDICLDLRIEMDDMINSDLSLLKTLAQHYQSSAVRKFLIKILRKLNDGD